MFTPWIELGVLHLLPVACQCTIIGLLFSDDYTLMFEPSKKFVDAWCFSRFDPQDLLAPGSAHPIELDGQRWPSAEHYYQANKFTGKYAQTVAQAADASEAHRLGNRWFKRKRSDFKKLRMVLMTRALYTKAQMYPELREALLASNDQLIAEMSQYDYFWGIGRDQRGHNQLGKIWMDIRAKLKQDLDRE